MMFGAAASRDAAVIDDKTYAVTPATLQLKVGIVTGEVTALTVTTDRATLPPGCFAGETDREDRVEEHLDEPDRPSMSPYPSGKLNAVLDRERTAPVGAIGYTGSYREHSPDVVEVSVVSVLEARGP